MINKKSIIFNIVGIILTLVSLFIFLIFSYYLFKINILPTKYLIIGYGGYTLIQLGLIFLAFRKGSKIINSIAMLIMAMLSFGVFFITNYLNNTYHFLNNTYVNFDKLNYSVIVLKDSSYDQINTLNNKIISYLDDNYKEDIKKELSSKINYKEILVSEFGVLSDQLINSEVDAICLEESYLTLIYEEIEDFQDKVKVIYTFEVQIKGHQEEVEDIDVMEEPFILYISGIDQYGNVNSVRGRSDVNQIVVVNPKTNRILLVNTPRDYYVQLAGTTGLKDKLTHAGIYGIDKSIGTLENLYDININYYLRVNFNTLIKIVDVIGGIDIESDISFVPWTDRSVYITKGLNHMDGKTALAYARERRAYKNGDFHRAANQQQVITAIIDKVSTSSVLISKYNSILNVLDGSFQTDMPMNTITSFVRYQLDKMPNWTVESITVTGTDSMNYTYSMGTNYNLYVMEPDYNSVEIAKRLINEVLSGV